MLTHYTGRLKGAGWAACAALLLAFVPAPSRAQTGVAAPPPPPLEDAPPRPDAVRQLNRALDLTREQRAQMTEIRRRLGPRGRELGERIRQARRAFEEAVYADQVDERVIEERARAVADAEAARLRLRAETELSIRRLLTPAQWNLFRELRRRAAEESRLPPPPPGDLPRPGRRRPRDANQPPPPGAPSRQPPPDARPARAPGARPPRPSSPRD